MNIEESKNKGIIAEFWDFLMKRKVWWIVPIIIMLILVAIFTIFAQSTYVSPLIYAL